MNERLILQAAIQDVTIYDTVNQYLQDDDFTDKGSILYGHIKEYYDRDPSAEYVDVEILISKLERLYPKNVDVFKNMLTDMEQVSIPNLHKEILEIKRHQTAIKLAASLLDNRSSDTSELMEQYRQYDNGLSVESEDIEVYIGTPVKDIISDFSSENLIKLYPHALNEALDGGVPAQTHIVLIAQPEVGKSMFAINMAAGFCRDGRRTLYVGNEDPIRNMQLRMISRMSGMPKAEIYKDVDKAQALANEKGYDNLIFAPLSPGTVKEIESLVVQHEPDILIIDQLRQLSYPGIDGEVQLLTKAGKDVRAITKKYDLVTVSVSQAGDSAANKLILDKGDLYMSKTSLVGDADVLIGIGMNGEYEKMNRRMITLIKNKISGVHDSFPVGVIPQLSKVVSL